MIGVWDGNSRVTLEEFPPKGTKSKQKPNYPFIYICHWAKNFFNSRVSYWGGGNPSSLFLCFHLCNENLYATLNGNFWIKHRQDLALNALFHVRCVTPARSRARIVCSQNWACSLDSASASTEHGFVQLHRSLSSRKKSPRLAWDRQRAPTSIRRWISL